MSVDAVEGRDFRTGGQPCYGIDAFPHADAHVQPFVAIDQVAAAAALDDVAATAAEDDVARAERGHTGAEEVLQTINESDVGEHAALGSGDGDIRRLGIIAAQEVAECRSRQPLRECEPIQDACV